MQYSKPARLGLILAIAVVMVGMYGAVQPAQASGGRTLVAFVGAASKPAMDPVIAAWEKATGVKVEVSYGGSGTLLTQILEEHVGDLYIPGSDDYAHKALVKHAIDKSGIKKVAYLVPTILVPKGNPKHITGLASLTRPGLRVVVAQKGAACLGDVAFDCLTKAGLLKAVTKNVVEYSLTCPQTLNDLLMGEADAVIAWDVYARQHPKKVQMVQIAKKYNRVRYIPGTVITWSKNKALARSFLAFLTGPTGRRIFQAHGYSVPTPPKHHK